MPRPMTEATLHAIELVTKYGHTRTSASKKTGVPVTAITRTVAYKAWAKDQEKMRMAAEKQAQQEMHFAHA